MVTPVPADCNIQAGTPPDSARTRVESGCGLTGSCWPCVHHSHLKTDTP